MVWIIIGSGVDPICPAVFGVGPTVHINWAGKLLNWLRASFVNIDTNHIQQEMRNFLKHILSIFVTVWKNKDLNKLKRVYCGTKYILKVWWYLWEGNTFTRILCTFPITWSQRSLYTDTKAYLYQYSKYKKNTSLGKYFNTKYKLV